MVDSNDMFCGWILEADKERVLELGDKLEGRIESLESFQWRAGGGTCWRGTLKITTTHA